jgi:signal transduction histidine kinase
VGSGDRHTAGVTTALIISYVGQRGGPGAVKEVIARSGVTHTEAELVDETHWSSYDEKIALFEAAATVLEDSSVALHIGETVLTQRVGGPLRILLRAVGSPGQVLRNIAATAPKFSTVCTMTAPDVGKNNATVTYQLHDGFAPSEMDCDYNMGLMSQVSVLFGLPAATVEHPECQVRGASQCVYQVKWSNASRIPGRRLAARVASLEDQLSTVTDRSEALQTTVADLVSQDDVDTVLARIAARAATAVRAHGFVLVVRTVEGDEPRVHFEGMSQHDATALAHRLLEETAANEDSMIVAEVVSARRYYGRLAALNPDRQTFFPEETKLLATYARHAAVALDAATSLEEARNREQTAKILLDLAHSLATATDRDEVALRLAESVPPVVQAERTVVYLYDRATNTLAARASSGYPSEVADTIKGLVFGPEDTPLFGGISKTFEPRYIRTATEKDPLIRKYMEAYGAAETIVVPIHIGTQLIGLVTATRTEERDPPEVDATLTDRLSGLADEAAVAFERVRLIEQEREVIQRLREADRFKVEFLSIVSHELRTPLAAIIGMARTILERGDELEDAMKDDFVASIVRRGEQLERLVNDLLHSSRDIELSLAPTDLSDIVDTAVAETLRLHPEADIRSTTNSRTPVVADGGRVRQIIDNLLINAIRYAPGSPIEVLAELDGDIARLSVSDKGPGISPELIEKAFEPYFQGAGATPGAKAGVGLGLYISRRIAEAHGGTIGMTSPPGEGTTVTLELPANPTI